MTTEQLDQPASKPQPVPSRLPPYFWDLLFVLVLPVVCFALDPVIFGNGLSNKPALNEPLQVATYVCVGLFVVSFFATYLSVTSRLSQYYLSGSLLAGGLVALLIGLWLLPLSIFGLLLLIGIFGFIPFGTALRFWLRFRALKLGKPNSILDTLAIFVGFTFPFIIPILLQHNGQVKLEKIISDVQVPEPETVRKTLSDLDKTWFCRTYCQAEVAGLFATGKIVLAEPEFAQLFKASTGVDYKQFLVEAD